MTQSTRYLDLHFRLLLLLLLRLFLNLFTENHFSILTILHSLSHSRLFTISFTSTDISHIYALEITLFNAIIGGSIVNYDLGLIGIIMARVSCEKYSSDLDWGAHFEASK